MKRVNFHLTEDQTRRLHERATATGLKVAEMIRRAVDAYLDREEKRDKREGR
jgi:predicted transcriptional regulator